MLNYLHFKLSFIYSLFQMQVFILASVLLYNKQHKPHNFEESNQTESTQTE